MIFGGDEEVKKIKAAFVAANADMSLVRPWLKVYERTRKDALICMGRYFRGKENLERLLAELNELEEMIRQCEILEGNRKLRFLDIIKDFKKLQGTFDDEFLISKEDKDFHTTLEAIVKLGPLYANKQENGVIFQSEIENLIALSKEGLERERPELFALTFFYLNHNNEELSELNFSQKIERVMEVYQNDFIAPIETTLIFCIKQAQAIKDRYEGNTDKKAQKLLADIEPFLKSGNDMMNAEERAMLVLKNFCHV